MKSPSKTFFTRDRDRNWIMQLLYSPVALYNLWVTTVPGQDYQNDKANNVRFTDDSAGPISYIHPDTGELITVPGGQVFALPERGFTSLPSVENALPAGKYRDFSAWDAVTCISSQDQTGIDGTANKAWTLTDDNGAASEYAFENTLTSVDTNWNTIAVFIGKDNDETRFPELHVQHLGGTVINEAVQLNTKTGATARRLSNGGSGVIDCNENWWLLWAAVQNNNTNDEFYVTFRPAASSILGGSTTTTGSTVVDYGQVLINCSRPLFPILVPGGTATATRASTPQLPLNLTDGAIKAREALEGKADGVELVTNGGFAAPGTGWSTTGLSTINTGVGRVLTDGSGAFASVEQLSLFTVGDTYEITYSVVDNTVGSLLIDNVPGASSAVGEHTYRFTAIVTYLNFKRSGVTDISIDNISVQKVLPAHGALLLEFTPGVAGDDVTTNYTYINILSAEDEDAYLSLYRNVADDYQLRWIDGTNTIAMDFDWQANTTYEVIALWGYHVDSLARKKQIWVREKGTETWTKSTLADVVDHWPIGDNEELVLGKDTEYMISSDKYKIRDIETYASEGWYESAASYYQAMAYMLGFLVTESEYDAISGERLVPDYLGATYAINPETGELITAAADEHLVVPGYGVVTHPQLTNDILYSDDFSNAFWVPYGTATKDDQWGVLTTATAYFMIGSSLLIGTTGKRQISFTIVGESSFDLVVEALDRADGSDAQAHTISVSTTPKRITFLADFSTSITFSGGLGLAFNRVGTKAPNGSKFKISNVFVSSYLADPYPLHIPTTTAPVTLQSRSGRPYFDLSSMPKATEALEGDGVNPATATHNIKFRVGVDADDVTNSTIINIAALKGTTADLLYLFKTSGGTKQVKVFDGTNYITIAPFDWQSSKAYEAEISTGYNATEAADKMQLSVREIDPYTLQPTGDGSWTVSSLANFDGAFDISAANKLTQAYGSGYNVGLFSIKTKSGATWRTPT